MKKLAYLGIALLIGFTATAQGNYKKDEMEKRKKKDDIFMNGTHSNTSAHGHSPLSKEQKEKFKGLSYYDINESYKVEVDFIEFTNPDHATMTLTNGVNHHYWVVGKVKFNLNGQDCELFVYQDKKFQKTHAEYKEYMFIPFRDKTNGEGSYAGGRYIQWHDPHGNHDVLDFNEAFNPASIYNENIHDPIVPYENSLPIKIEAGEKDFVLP